jgi:UDP-glucuronate 4-epimerase
MRLFLTGAAGFIGFHLANALRDRGNEVLGIDNFNPYYSPKLKVARSALLQSRGVDVVTADLSDTLALRTLFEQFEPTHCVHLAAQAGVRYSITHPQAYIDSNIQGFLNILEILRHHPQIPLTYASSSSVYGTNEKIPFAESDLTDRPANFYGATKKANELMAYSYHHLYGIKATGLRFFTVYGPWGRPDMAYFSFAKAIDEGRPIELYSNGQMRRDFTYIDDIVAGTIKAIYLAAPLELFNLGNHRPEELTTLVALIENSLKKKANLRLLPPQPGEIAATFADISHSHNTLGYTPQVSLQEGMERFLDWFQNHRSINS